MHMKVYKISENFYNSLLPILFTDKPRRGFHLAILLDPTFCILHDQNERCIYYKKVPSLYHFRH